VSGIFVRTAISKQNDHNIIEKMKTKYDGSGVKRPEDKEVEIRKHILACLRHEGIVEPQKSVNTAITQQYGKCCFLRAEPNRTVRCYTFLR
jgi:hypothetical protein